MTSKSTLSNYLKASYNELKLVSWPSKDQAIEHTILIIGISFVFALLFGVVDYFLSQGLDKLLTL